jgi:hypothetical protein
MVILEGAHDAIASWVTRAWTVSAEPLLAIKKLNFRWTLKSIG